MDYQEYMNIINKVRKSKELERVRTEQLRLASMYAREKKRQEELKKEEDRLQKERIKIDMEKNEPPPTQVVTQSVFNQGLNRPANQNLNGNATRTNGLEKGQLDNDEVEQNKLSPQRKIVGVPTDVFPVPEIVNKPKPPPPTNFQPKQFVPGAVAAQASQPAPATVQPSQPSGKFQSFAPFNETSAPVAVVPLSDGRAEREEQLRMAQMWLEQRRQQVKVEQENLERLREEQLRQEKEREEIRRLEIERLRQIQEEQRRLEEERRRQEEQMRLEQMRLEEE